MLPRTFILSLAFLALSATALRAEPKDDVQAAVKKLAESANYSWSSATEGGFGSNPIDGKTEKDGFTTLTLSLQDNAYQVVIKGGKDAIKTADGWKTSAQLATPGDGGFNPDMFAAFIVQGFKAPAVQAKEITDKLEKIQKTDDGYTADLSADAAKELLAFRPRGAPADAPQMTVKNSKGSVKVWIKDGVLSKMQIHLTGTITFMDNDRDTDRTTTTEIKDIGTTKITVPEEAKTKLAT